MASNTTSTAGAGVESTSVNGPAARPKLHGRAFYESIGSPKYIIAPMVDQSEFAWRMLSRSFLPPAQRKSILAYSPMLHARLFAETEKYRNQHFQPQRVTPLDDSGTATKKPKGPHKASKDATESQPSSWKPPHEAPPYLDGNPSIDRPLIVQFCANDPAALLSAATMVSPFCDAVDLNLGCPQGIARKGHYGAFLQEDQQLIYNLINTLHKDLPIPVTAKIRILESKEETLEYAKNVLLAGASILTVHGRRREQKGHLTGKADWGYIKYLREMLPKETVIFANGNVLQHADLEECLRETGADGVMTAEGNLSDPGLFASLPPPGDDKELEGGQAGGDEYWRDSEGRGGWRVDAVMRRYLDILHEYVLGKEKPERRKLFVSGDDESWLKVSAESENQTEQPAKKKRKRGEGGGGGKDSVGPNLGPVQAHLFHLLRHFVGEHHDVRDALAKARAGDLDVFERILNTVERRTAEGLTHYEKTGEVLVKDGGKSKKYRTTDGFHVEEASTITGATSSTTIVTGTANASNEANGSTSNEAAPNSNTLARNQTNGMETQPITDGHEDEDDPDSSAATVRKCKRPWWIAQPIVRPLPKEALAKGALSLSKKDKAKQLDELRDAPELPASAAGEYKQPVSALPPDPSLAGSMEQVTSFPESRLVSG